MPISFPASPATGQTYTYLNKTWTYNGTTWDANTTASIASAVAPITYNATTQAVGINQAGITIAESQVTNLVSDLGAKAGLSSANIFTNNQTINTASSFSGMSIKNPNATSGVAASAYIDMKNSEGIAGASMIAPMYTDGSADIYFSTTPAGSRTADRRTTRFTIPSNGNAGSITNGRSRINGISTDTAGVLELASSDGVLNYIYKENGGGLVIANLNGARVSTYNASGHITNQYQPVWSSDITSSTNNYSTFNTAGGVNVGFTQTNSSTITVQTAGKYYVRAQQLLQTSGGGYYQLRKNDVTVKHAYASASSFMDYTVGALLDLAAGDTIRVVAAITLSNSWNGAHSSLDIVKVA